MLIHDGPLRHMLGQLTNTVYEEPTIDDFGEHGQLLSKGDGEVCPYTLFLGIFVSLLPKVRDVKISYAAIYLNDVSDFWAPSSLRIATAVSSTRRLRCPS